MKKTMHERSPLGWKQGLRPVVERVKEGIPVHDQLAVLQGSMGHLWSGNNVGERLLFGTVLTRWEYLWLSFCHRVSEPA
jgi:hypothetical protein